MNGITVTGKKYDEAYEKHKRSWPEDYKDENGNYDNICIKCNQVFSGYKRRVVCKLCSTT